MDAQELQHIGLAKDIQMTVAGTFSRVLFFRDRIEIISPNKPNSSQQKYRLTAQGKAVVQAQQNEGNS